jgi:hypothetical protein
MKIKSRGDRNLEEVLIIKEVVISSLVSNSNAMNEDCNHSRVDLMKIRLYKKKHEAS